MEEACGLSTTGVGSGRLEYIDEAMAFGYCTTDTKSGSPTECLMAGGGSSEGACGSSTMVDGSGQLASTEEAGACGLFTCATESGSLRECLKGDGG